MNLSNKALAKLQICCFLLIFMLQAAAVQAQLSLYFGPNISTVRTDHLEIGPRIGRQWGFHYRFKPVLNSRFHPHLQLEFSGQGYTQYFLNKEYENRIAYMHFTPGITYRIFDYLTVSTGIDLSALIRGRQKTDDQVFKITDNYQPGDKGLRGSICLLDNRSINIYLSYMRGLHDILHYERIDPIGNFTGVVIKDIKNTCIQANVRFTFRSSRKKNEKK